MSSSRMPGGGQRGAVLVVGLVMLAVMTLLVISMFKTSVLELKIGGASQIAALNFANAEAAINTFITKNDGRFAPGYLAKTGSLGPITDQPSYFGGTVQVTTTEIQCGPWTAVGFQLGGQGSLNAVYFNIRGVAIGSLGGTTSVHQGARTFAPPGSC